MSVRRTASPSRAFTLTELLVATVVLIAVLLAVGKIFSTTSRVTGLGQGNADLLQEVMPISQQLRRDFSNMSPDGVLVIRCVSVPNDINGAVLLNPNLPVDARIRCDQVLFFSDETQGTSTFTTGGTAEQRVQSAESRIYYGHAFSLGESGKPALTSGFDKAYDVGIGESVYPWSSGTFDATRTTFEGNGIFDASPLPGDIQLTPPDARRWLFVRQHAGLLDDDFFGPNSPEKTTYGFNTITAKSLFLDAAGLGFDPSPQLRDGRVDGAATELPELKRVLEWEDVGETQSQSVPRPWRDTSTFGTGGGQMAIIADQLLYYPRAERAAPGPTRIDQALTNHVISSGCSSVRIDWTYEDGTGDFTDQSLSARGVMIAPDVPQPWFGLREDDRGVFPYELGQGPNNEDFPWSPAGTIYAENIERYPEANFPVGIEVYEAVFGFNKSRALSDNGQGQLVPDETLGYTPWPSALRFTMTLHDPGLNLESGREFEVIVSIPQSAR